jgi:uncharacterized protein YjaG (DUF416 family)
MNNNRNKLATLSPGKQLIYGYLTCLRLFPSYKNFSDDYNYGDPSTLNAVLSYINVQIFAEEKDERVINFFLQEIEQVTPKPADFETFRVTGAVNACHATRLLLKFLLTNDIKKIKEISKLAHETVYLQVMYTGKIRSDSGTAKRVEKNKLMSHEQYVNDQIIEFLQKTEELTEYDVDDLSKMQENIENV